MNKKILISLSVIGVVAAIVVGGTVAYFSDTEKSETNTFSTGAIDITIEVGEEWSQGWVIEDMIPGDVGYIVFNILNPGVNPVNVWTQTTNIILGDGEITGSECVYGGGEWSFNPLDSTYACLGPYTARFDLLEWIAYGLSTKKGVDGEEYIIMYEYIDEDDYFAFSDYFNESYSDSIHLGQVKAGGSMRVTQSYHLVPGTANWAQNDTMSFDVEIFAQQFID